MYFINKLKEYNILGNDRSSFTFPSSPNTFITLFPYTSLIRRSKIISIASSLATPAAGTGVEGKIGLYQLNNGKDLSDGAVKINEVTINITSTSGFSLNSFINQIENMENFALGFGINGSFSTYPAIRTTPALIFDTQQERKRFMIRVASYMPNSVQSNDDIDTISRGFFCPIFLIENK